MKVYIQTDIEGIAGFVFFENRADQTPEGFHHRQRMRKLLTAEVDAAVKGAFEAGANEVLVSDSHGSGYNIIFEDLDPRCEIIHGRNCSGPHWLPEFDSSCDALVLIGMHAMGGTPGALLSHSHWVVNGGALHLSEASMACALAGCRGVPSVFISGDQYVVAEVSEKIPSIRSAVVKKSLGAYIARCLMPAKSCEMIRSGVKSALKSRRKIKPFRIDGPICLNLLDSPKHSPPLKLVLEKDVEGADMEGAFTKAVLSFPWNKFNVDLPDGFVYP